MTKKKIIALVSSMVSLLLIAGIGLAAWAITTVGTQTKGNLNNVSGGVTGLTTETKLVTEGTKLSVTHLINTPSEGAQITSDYDGYSIIFDMPDAAASGEGYDLNTGIYVVPTSTTNSSAALNTYLECSGEELAPDLDTGIGYIDLQLRVPKSLNLPAFDGTVYDVIVRVSFNDNTDTSEGRKLSDYLSANRDGAPIDSTKGTGLEFYMTKDSGFIWQAVSSQQLVVTENGENAATVLSENDIANIRISVNKLLKYSSDTMVNDILNELIDEHDNPSDTSKASNFKKHVAMGIKFEFEVVTKGAQANA